MGRIYRTAQAFQAALEDRLKQEARLRGTPFETLRTKVLIERLLARLFSHPEAPWLLKGGYALELRYRPKARVTRDVDLAATLVGHRSAAAVLEQLCGDLRAAAEVDAEDFMRFDLGAPRHQLLGPPLGGASLPVVVRLKGKELGRFRLDVGLGDAVIPPCEVLVGEDLLAFAGIEPARVRAISACQQFAEKLHAYTLELGKRENSRVKDLVDLLLLIERGSLDPQVLRDAVEVTFRTRGKQKFPRTLEPPPPRWAKEYNALARGADLMTGELDLAFDALCVYWQRSVDA